MRRKGNRSSRGQRRASVITTHQPITSRRLLRPTLTVGTIHDRRSYRPDRSVTPPSGAYRHHAKLVLAKPKQNRNNRRSTKGLVAGINFAQPRNMHLCRKRKKRSQVMHALNIAGRRGVGRGKPRRTNFWSKIGC